MIQFYRQSINNQKFVLLFLVSIFFAIYGVIQLGFNLPYIEAFLYILSGNWYSFGLLTILLFNTVYVYKLYEKNQFYILRCKTKKQYLTHLIKQVCFNNLCLYFINMILLMIGLNVFNHNSAIAPVKTYETSNLIYLIYTILKFGVLTQIFTIFNTLLWKLISEKIVIIGNLFLYVNIIATTMHIGKVISSIRDIEFSIQHYFNSYFINYSSFTFEVIVFLFYISICLLFLKLLEIFILKKMKRVTE